MYKRVAEQASLSIASSAIGMLSVFVAVGSASKADYGAFMASLAVQYVIVRVIMGGILVELQKSLASAVNGGGDVPLSLAFWVVALSVFNALTLLMLSLLGYLEVPSLGILLNFAMTLSIATFSLKAWRWYRTGTLASEAALLALLYLSRDVLSINKLYFIYHIYYIIQFSFGAIGVYSKRDKFFIVRDKILRVPGIIAGTFASLTTTVRDRFTIAVAGYIFPPASVADLTYLLTVVKGSLSIGSALNSVKFVYAAGNHKSINGRGLTLVLENVVLAAITLLGYISLWYYTLNFGNSEYLTSLTLIGVAIMTTSVILTFNYSNWYLNQVIKGKLKVFNIGAALFFITLFIAIKYAKINHVFNATTFYGFAQLLLILSAGSCWWASRKKII